MPRQLCHRLKTSICIASLLFGAATAAWGIRSIFRQDNFLIGTQSTGNADAGTSTERFIRSNRGSIAIYVSWLQWYYDSAPNPFPGNDGPQWLSAPAGETLAVPNSRWHFPRTNGATYDVRGFDSLGFGAGRIVVHSTAGRTWTTRSQTAVRLPHWFVALLLIGPPLLVLRKWRRLRRRLAAGLCPACGYDLRASKDRCPECGRVIESGDSK